MLGGKEYMIEMLPGIYTQIADIVFGVIFIGLAILSILEAVKSKLDDLDDIEIVDPFL